MKVGFSGYMEVLNPQHAGVATSDCANTLQCNQKFAADLRQETGLNLRAFVSGSSDKMVLIEDPGTPQRGELAAYLANKNIAFEHHTRSLSDRGECCQGQLIGLADLPTSAPVQ